MIIADSTGSPDITAHRVMATIIDVDNLLTLVIIHAFYIWAIEKPAEVL